MLSEEKINDLAAEMVKGGKSVNWLARAIEAAVLGEQAKAEPAAYKQCSACAQYAASLHCSRCSPLYLHPTPAPEGMVLVPREVLNQCLPIIEAAINRAVKENFGRCDENAHKYIDLLDAMLASAEKEAGK